VEEEEPDPIPDTKETQEDKSDVGDADAPPIVSLLNLDGINLDPNALYDPNAPPGQEGENIEPKIIEIVQEIEPYDHEKRI